MNSRWYNSNVVSKSKVNTNEFTVIHKYDDKVKIKEYKCTKQKQKKRT